MREEIDLTRCRMSRMTQAGLARCANPTEITQSVYAGIPMVLCRECATLLRDELTKELAA